MITPKNVSDFFLQLSEPEIGDILSNLKIQKLVYYAQGFHLAMYNSPLFEEDFQAWEHGPVVPSLYHELKQYGSGPVPQNNDFNVEEFDDNQIELLKEVYDVYGQFSAWKLRNMTHEEGPWKSTQRNEVISKESLNQYFQTQLV